MPKISKIQDLDKLLYGEEQKTKLAPKKKIEITISDNENQQFANHPVNKTIKMMSYLAALMYKVKEFNSFQQELLSRCAKYFNLVIPKQYKSNPVELMKNKDFLSQAKEKMYQQLNSAVNTANNIAESELPSQGQYKYHIGKGNNNMLVKSVFKQRQWWVQSDKENFEECNFIWTQWIKDRHINALTS